VKRFVLDTNLYIGADRDLARAEELERFLTAFLPAVYLHSVVVQELLAGAIHGAREKLVLESLIEPFERRGRLITPTYASWKAAGLIMAKLVQRRLLSPGGFKRSFQNDCLLAASCREQGLVLISANRDDFALIQRVHSFTLEAPWPE
jgi:predicted nucleic acid-binding protein